MERENLNKQECIEPPWWTTHRTMCVKESQLVHFHWFLKFILGSSKLNTSFYVLTIFVVVFCRQLLHHCGATKKKITLIMTQHIIQILNNHVTFPCIINWILSFDFIVWKLLVDLVLPLLVQNIALGLLL
jgi:hypothetical protein